MCARTSVVLFMCFLLSRSVTVHRYSEVDIASKTKVEIPAILISATISDLVVISAPIVKNARYYLHNPKGDAIKLNISRPRYAPPKENIINNEYDGIVIKYAHKTKSIFPLNNYKVFNVHSQYINSTADTFAENAREMNANDFIIGPLVEDDHGNWVLSAYSHDHNGEWIETFQVITIEITEYIRPKPSTAQLHEGATFALSFAHPIPHLTSCELTAPRSTFDRFYDRDRDVSMDICGYVVKNVTKQDQGMWRITAVGKMVFGTQLYLEVLDGTSRQSLKYRS